MTRLLLLSLLLLCVPAWAGKPKHPPACSAFGWCKVGTLPGNFQGGSYTPLWVSGSSIGVYGNNWNNGYGEWNAQYGTWSSLTNPVTVVSTAAVYDEPCATNGGTSNYPGYCVRTSAVQRLTNGSCVAMLAVGNGYPTTDSYRPAWATSDDCRGWIYRGRMLIEGSFNGYGQTDTMAMVVNEVAPTMPDHAVPLSNRYVVFVNYQCLEGVCPGLIAVYSTDGVSWWRGRDAFGVLIDYWPAGLDQPSFPTAARTSYGIHIIAGNTWPATAHTHVFSCDGKTFRVLETNAATNTGSGKGTNLAFDGTYLHALTSGTHLRLPERDWGC